MSRASNWTCRACGLLLGHVRNGVLRPLVVLESVDGRGVARVACPKCGRLRGWFPAGAAGAAAGDRRPAAPSG